MITIYIHHDKSKYKYIIIINRRGLLICQHKQCYVSDCSLRMSYCSHKYLAINLNVLHLSKNLLYLLLDRQLHNRQVFIGSFLDFFRQFLRDTKFRTHLRLCGFFFSLKDAYKISVLVSMVS